MRKVSLRNVTVNDRLAVNIRIESPLPNVHYRLRIDRGTLLKPKHINRLKNEGVRSIYVVDQDTQDLAKYVQDEDLKEAEREIVQELQKTARAIKDENVYQVPAEELSESVQELLDVIRNTSVSMAYTSLKTHTNYLAPHQFDTCKLTLQFALVHADELLDHYLSEHSKDSLARDKFLEQLGMGTLLHDVGNWSIPQETLEKREELNSVEWEAIKEHPKLGFEMLGDFDDIPRLARMPALHHHERYSGQGYPKGLAGQEIHYFGRIAAICDVYAALTSERPYRIELTPNRAIGIMKNMQEGEEPAFDPDLMDKFLDLIPPYPIGQDVVFDNGKRGVVSGLDEGFHTPTVRVLFDGNEKLDDYYEIVANTDDNPDIVN
jgi:HD-GYP domain-containing protein (c-di-GMP phosphodiesterase class II)